MEDNMVAPLCSTGGSAESQDNEIQLSHLPEAFVGGQLTLLFTYCEGLCNITTAAV